MPTINDFIEGAKKASTRLYNKTAETASGLRDRFSGSAAAAPEAAVPLEPQAGYQRAANGAIEAVEGAPKTSSFGLRRIEQLGKAKGAARLLGSAAVIQPAIEGAYDSYNTGTEAYAKRLGVEPSDNPDSVLGTAKNTGIRALGALTDVGNAALQPFGLAQDFADKSARKPIQVKPPITPEQTAANLAANAAKTGSARAPVTASNVTDEQLLQSYNSSDKLPDGTGVAVSAKGEPEFIRGNSVSSNQGFGPGGTVSTLPSNFEADNAKLNNLIQGRIASGDLEGANQLAATAEQRAAVNAAYGERNNPTGLRALSDKISRAPVTAAQRLEGLKSLAEIESNSAYRNQTNSLANRRIELEYEQNRFRNKFETSKAILEQKNKDRDDTRAKAFHADEFGASQAKFNEESNNKTIDSFFPPTLNGKGEPVEDKANKAEFIRKLDFTLARQKEDADKEGTASPSTLRDLSTADLQHYFTLFKLDQKQKASRGGFQNTVSGAFGNNQQVDSDDLRSVVPAPSGVRPGPFGSRVTAASGETSNVRDLQGGKFNFLGPNDPVDADIKQYIDNSRKPKR